MTIVYQSTSKCIKNALFYGRKHSHWNKDIILPGYRIAWFPYSFGITSGIRNKKKTLQSRFLRICRTVFCPPLIVGHQVPSCTKAVSDYCICLTGSPKISTEEANLPLPYRTTLSQLRSTFYSPLHFYRERIEIIPSPLCPSCGVEPHGSRIFCCRTVCRRDSSL